MASYRIYYLDDQGHIAHAIEFVLESDAEARAAAEAQRDGRAMELWNLSRVVEKYPAD